MMRTAVFYARRHRRQLEAETLAYLRTTGAVLTQAEVTALNENIRDIKYSSGISLVAATGRLATVALGAFIDAPSVDLRAYEGFVATFTETTKTAVCLIGAPGTAEAAVTDVLAGWDLTTWTGVNVTVVDANTYTANAVGSTLKSGNVFVNGALYKGIFDITATAGTCNLSDNSGNSYWVDGSVNTYKTWNHAVLVAMLYGVTQQLM
jgi:hypothetical protein